MLSPLHEHDRWLLTQETELGLGLHQEFSLVKASLKEHKSVQTIDCHIQERVNGLIPASNQLIHVDNQLNFSKFLNHETVHQDHDACSGFASLLLPTAILLPPITLPARQWHLLPPIVFPLTWPLSSSTAHLDTPACFLPSHHSSPFPSPSTALVQVPLPCEELALPSLVCGGGAEMQRAPRTYTNRQESLKDSLTFPFKYWYGIYLT